MRREFRVEEGWRSWVDGTRHEHQAFGEYVCREAENSVSVHAGVLEVDAGCSIGADNDLEL